jgi:uncharacterized protein (DUF1501 family)
MRLSRRSFLKSLGIAGIIGISKSLFPSWMPSLAFGQPGADQGDILIVIFLRGGMDGLSAVVPYFEAAYYDARPTQHVPEASVIDLDGRFGLHPAMLPLKELYDDGVLGVIHAAGSPNDTRSHFDAMQFMEYGTPGEKSIGTGWLGRYLQLTAERNQSPFRAIGMGQMVAQSLRGPVSPLAIKSIADFHFKGRESELVRLQQSLAALYQIDAPEDLLGSNAALVFDTAEMLQQLSAEPYTPQRGSRYPNSEFGQGLKQIAQLIKADVGLEVACIDLGGWDTHEGQGTLDGTFAGLLGELSSGLHALYTDLSEQMQGITVVAMSEFGRCLKENASAGTDHGHGNVMLLLGGGVKGRQVYCDWPTLAPAALSGGDLAVTTDYRDVLAEVLQERLGSEGEALAQIFLRHRVRQLGVLRSRWQLAGGAHARR